MIQAPGKAPQKRNSGAHSLQGGQRRFQTGRRSDHRTGGDRSATEMKPGPFTIASMDLPDWLTRSGHGTHDEIHGPEQTSTPCRRNALDPVRNPPIQLCTNLGIEMTGFKP